MMFRIRFAYQEHESEELTMNSSEAGFAISWWRNLVDAPSQLGVENG